MSATTPEPTNQALEPPASVCPKCGSEDYDQEHHEFDVTRAGSLPDCSWWRCANCGHLTEPE